MVEKWSTGAYIQKMCTQTSQPPGRTTISWPRWTRDLTARWLDCIPPWGSSSKTSIVTLLGHSRSRWMLWKSMQAQGLDPPECRFSNVLSSSNTLNRSKNRSGAIGNRETVAFQVRSWWKSSEYSDNTKSQGHSSSQQEGGRIAKHRERIEI